MAEPEAKRLKITTINTILPSEMIEQILTFLNYKDIYQAQLTCKLWKEIIINGNLLKKASGKILKSVSFSFL